eukprot:TRINITY_DN42117_c0_g1_i1.p1 TRINITY_DN42117_c0_g1~~TRINITY_DN42117_c0_g1_i1.p1  ORF type:complete len:611 (+),score=170.21 TRINITY_DN42117_c0_g1_i1:92-1924(+)
MVTVRSTSLPQLHGGSSELASDWGGRVQIQATTFSSHIDVAGSTKTHYLAARDSGLSHSRSALRSGAWSLLEQRCSSPITGVGLPQADVLQKRSPTKRAPPRRVITRKHSMQPEDMWRTTSCVFPVCGSGLLAGSGKSMAQRMLEDEVASVRALAADRPSRMPEDGGDAARGGLRSAGGASTRDGKDNDDGDLTPRSRHQRLMRQLRSRTVRAEAEHTKSLLQDYRCRPLNDALVTFKCPLDIQLAKVIESSMARMEELQAKLGAAERASEQADWQCQLATSKEAKAADEPDLKPDMKNLTFAQKNELRKKELKRQEELARRCQQALQKREECHQATQDLTTELRDCRMLLEEYKKARLEKFQKALLRAQGGTRIRRCVREMIRLGAQRVLCRLEEAGPALEPWMREVVVNMCHVELKLESLEKQQSRLRRVALQPVNEAIEEKCGQKAVDRVEDLCRQTHKSMRSIRAEGGGIFEIRLAQQDDFAAGDPWAVVATPDQEDGVTSALLEKYETGGEKLPPVPEMAPRATESLQTVQREVADLRRLLEDMRQNVAAVVTNRMRQYEKQRSHTALQVSAWAWSVLSTIVSEDFAKTVMKEVKKATPQGKLTH